MVEGRAMIRLLVLVVAAASLLPSSECSTLIHQQLQIPGKGYKFRVSRYDDGRKTPYRIYFWDTTLTGSSYRFDGDGNLVFFKAGSDIYSKVFIKDGDGSVEFSLKTESVGGKNDDGDNKEYAWEDFSCSQCSTVLHSICGTESSEPGGLTKFCDAVDLSTLHRDGAESVKILCGHRVDTCAALAAECDSQCETGDDDATVDSFEGCDGFEGSIGNGLCDAENNNEQCGYDGGDCCECTCVPPNSADDDDIYCRRLGGIFGFACIDPSASCVDDDDVTVDEVDNCNNVFRQGDGICDLGNNNALCGYDGGDCCECTCEPPENSYPSFSYCSARSDGFACIDPAASCVDDDDVTVELLENCNVFSLGNGLCDAENNNEQCGYDGGDCCECTCAPPENSYDDDSGSFCSKDGSGFACIDPAASCVDDDDVTVELVENCNVFSLGNGACNIENNNEQCGYDGGDCCECTCVPPENSYDDDSGFICGSRSGFACIDPSAACVDDDGITVELVDNCDNVLKIGDGVCDVENNNEQCGYDGGDCCECTCVPPENSGDDDNGFLCSKDGSGFACIDPSASCVDDDDVTVDLVDNCDGGLDLGNGDCDIEYNNEQCGYDGGDCCECTCVPPENSGDDDSGFFCSKDGSGFACIDPAAPCVDDDDITVDILDECFVEGLGDGRCNEENNKAECRYDGGDCCECTCESGFYNDCGVDGFACIDPSAACVDDDDITAEMFDVCDIFGSAGLGNGNCDDGNNIPECNYDGGDCCSCTCEDSAYWTCGQSGFACIDPEAPCVDDDDVTVDLVANCEYPRKIGDSYCDKGNNNEICGYDGGDCCFCTCVEPEVPDDYTYEDGSEACGSQGYACIDPSAECFDGGSN